MLIFSFFFFFFFAQNIDCEYNRLNEAVLLSAHNLCFGSQIRKIHIHVAKILNFRFRKVYYLWGEHKDADQLCGYCTADLRLCFRIIIFRLLVF